MSRDMNLFVEYTLMYWIHENKTGKNMKRQAAVFPTSHIHWGFCYFHVACPSFLLSRVLREPLLPVPIRALASWVSRSDCASSSSYLSRERTGMVGSDTSIEWTTSIDCLNINTLWPSDAIWWHRSGSTLAQVMACCLMAPSHYLNQCWLIISKVQWHLSQGNFTRAINH